MKQILTAIAVICCFTTNAQRYDISLSAGAVYNGSITSGVSIYEVYGPVISRAKVREVGTISPMVQAKAVRLGKGGVHYGVFVDAMNLYTKVPDGYYLDTRSNIRTISYARPAVGVGLTAGKGLGLSRNTKLIIGVNAGYVHGFTQKQNNPVGISKMKGYKLGASLEAVHTFGRLGIGIAVNPTYSRIAARHSVLSTFYQMPLLASLHYSL